VVAGEGLDSALIVAGAPQSTPFLTPATPTHLTGEVHRLLGSRQPAKVVVDDDPVQAVIYEYQQLAEQLEIATCEVLRNDKLIFHVLFRVYLGHPPSVYFA
jgi:hypothetical protein